MKQTDRQHGADKVNSAGRWKWRKAIVTDSAEQDCHREVTPAAEARRGAGSQIMNLPKWIKWFMLQVELYIWNIISVLTSGCNKYFNPILLLNLMIFFLFCPLTWGQIPGITLPLKLYHDVLLLLLSKVFKELVSIRQCYQKQGSHTQNSCFAVIKTRHMNICN